MFSGRLFSGARLFFKNLTGLIFLGLDCQGGLWKSSVSTAGTIPPGTVAGGCSGGGSGPGYPASSCLTYSFERWVAYYVSGCSNGWKLVATQYLCNEDGCSNIGYCSKL